MQVTRGRSWRRCTEALGALAIVLAGEHADAAGLSRVVFVGDDPELLHALSVSLASWHVEVVQGSEPQLGATLPEAAALADAVCARTNAEAAVWISRTPGGLALWVYDARTHELVSRPVTDGPPYSSPVAASLSLATKTLLKKSLVAPEGERFGAGLPPPPPPPVAPPPEEARSTVYLEGTAGARFFALSTQPVEARFGLGLSYWPAVTRWFGFFLDVSLGPGAAITPPGIDARLLSVTTALGGRARFDVSRRLALEGGVGFVLGITSLDGFADGANVGVLRANPGLRTAFTLDFKLNRRASIGLVNALDTAFRRQSYTLGGVTVAEGGFVSWDVGLRLRVGVD